MHHPAGPGGQLLHLLVLVVWVPAVVAWWSLDRAPRRPGLPVLGGLVAALYYSGLVHLVEQPVHQQESPLFGAFFAAAAVGQLGLAVLLSRRPAELSLRLGALAQLAVLGVWVLSRTTGLPVGPQPWLAEPVGFLDLSCALAEVLAVGAALRLLRHPLGEPAGALSASRGS